MAILENTHYRFITDKKTGAFHVLMGIDHGLQLAQNMIAVSGRTTDRSAFCHQLKLKNSQRPATHLAPESLYLTFKGEETNIGLRWEVRVALGDDGELIKWRVICQNNGGRAVFLDRIHLLKSLYDRESNFQFRPAQDWRPCFFANGWQSWSFTGCYGRDDRMRRSNLGFLQEPMVLNPGTPKYRVKGKFSSDMFAALVDRDSGQGLVLGFLSQKDQFGTITVDMRRGVSLSAWANADQVCLQPGKELQTDWFALTIIHPDVIQPFDHYLNAAAQDNGVCVKREPPVGWCSWYHYYQNISASKLENNLKAIERIADSTPLKLFQIDDGFQAQVGDWLTFNKKFPRGLKPLVEKIKKAGMQPGIWLAPFIVHPNSQLAKQHPDWLLRKANGRLARAGFVWNMLGLALDLTVPEALDYVREVIRTAVHGWGFTYLKLDFLYAAALECAYRDNTKTRAQVLRVGMRAVREAAGENIDILGCGAPLGSLLGLVDMMRISADVSGHWTPDYFNLGFLFKREPHMPAARNAINNAITRAMLHKKWWVNDPDCLLVRDDTHLTLAEVRSLATVIAMTGGSIIVSDDMQQLSKKRLQILQSLIPPHSQRARVLDWKRSGTPALMRVDMVDEAGGWHLLSFANWGEKPREVRLTAGEFGLQDKRYAVSAFWQKKSWTSDRGEPLFTGELEVHQTILLLVREDDKHISNHNRYAHISTGHTHR